MALALSLQLFTLSLLLTLSAADPKPQYFPLFPPPNHFLPPLPGPGDSVQSGTHDWQRTSHNLTSAGIDPGFLDPLSAVPGEDSLKNDIPRQIYGLPPPTSQGGYPQIYRIDNLIIIANPVQSRPQPCIPQQPQGGGRFPDDVENKFGNDEPNPCTWAIVACCSPGSENIRYNCFELFQCLGAFVGRSPCNRVVVQEAAKSALAFYSRSNSTSTNPNNNINSLNNQPFR